MKNHESRRRSHADLSDARYVESPSARVPCAGNPGEVLDRSKARRILGRAKRMVEVL